MATLDLCTSRLTAIFPYISLQVINHVTLVVSQNTLDYETLVMYTVNVS